MPTKLLLKAKSVVVSRYNVLFTWESCRVPWTLPSVCYSIFHLLLVIYNVIWISLSPLESAVEEIMRSAQEPNRNGGLMTPSPRPRIQSQFQSTVSVQKNRRFNILILVFRFAAFCFSLASAMFMFTNSRGGSGSPQWYNFDAFRYYYHSSNLGSLNIIN